MVGMGIDGLDVKQRAGFCTEGRGKFSLQIPRFGQVFKLPAGKDPTNPFQTITIDVSTSNA
jgi:hypothetical protein